MTRKTKLNKSQKLVTDKNGKVRIVTDHRKVLKSKPAGQQFFDAKKVKVKR